eukprot:UN21934
MVFHGLFGAFCVACRDKKPFYRKRLHFFDKKSLIILYAYIVRENESRYALLFHSNFVFHIFVKPSF